MSVYSDQRLTKTSTLFLTVARVTDLSIRLPDHAQLLEEE